MHERLKELAIALHRIEAIQFGEFQLKSGEKAPIYIDVRMIISHPCLLREIAKWMWEQVASLHFECVCGVPYTAIPIATAISLEHNIPMVMRRKEVKSYGLKKVIEGHFAKGDNCLVVEDLVTTGTSVLETIAPLEEVGLKVTDILILIDREQGGKENLKAKGYCLHSVIKISEILEILHQEGKLSPALYEETLRYFKAPKTH